MEATTALCMEVTTALCKGAITALCIEVTTALCIEVTTALCIEATTALCNIECIHVVFRCIHLVELTIGHFLRNCLIEVCLYCAYIFSYTGIEPECSVLNGIP